MDLLREINTAAKTWVPPEKPLVEMHPMTKMMMKAMDTKRVDKGDKKKKSNKKSLNDYLDLSSPAKPDIEKH